MANTLTRYPTPKHMRPKEAAKYTGISLSKLAKLRMKGQRHNSPPFIKVAGCIIYRASDLDEWLEDHLVEAEVAACGGADALSPSAIRCWRYSMGNSLSKFMTDGHKHAARMLGYALTMANTDIWLGAGTVFSARLTDAELASLGFAVLKAQGPDNAALTVEAVLGRAATPDVPFISEMDQAAYWADCAEPTYIKAVVLAGYNRMSSADQVRFLDYVHGRAAA